MTFCLNCGAGLTPDKEEGWQRCPRGCGSFFYDGDELALTPPDLRADRAEDEAQLRDYLAAEGFGQDRSFGG